MSEKLLALITGTSLCLIPAGLNVVGRGSSSADHEGMIDKWKAEYAGMPVHGRVFVTEPVIRHTCSACHMTLCCCRGVPSEQQYLFQPRCHM